VTKPVVLVIGATGLIGEALTSALHETCQVHCISRHPGTRDDVEWHAIDLALDKQVQGLPSRADAVVYLAQSEFFRAFPQRSADIFQVNVRQPLHFLEYARASGVRTFVYASSGGVYGSGDQPMKEELAIAARGNLGFYPATKLCSEILAQTYAAFFKVVVLRYFFVYGPRQRPTMLIPRLIHSVKTGEAIALQGQDGIRINPTYVSDAVAATKRALELDFSDTINVAGPEVLTMRQIGALIGKALGREPLFSVDQKASPSHLMGDISRMGQLLTPPRVKFAEGLEAMLKGEE
jgi:nucleoside-diphosphate-sugar epimerase